MSHSSKPSLKKEIFLCLLSVILLVLSFPNYNLWILAWLGFVPLFFALKGKSQGKAFLLSYITGVIFWVGTIYWLIHVTLPGLILLVLYLALYFGIFGLFFSICPLSSVLCPLTVASIWVLLEYIRSYLFTGFPWALLGYSQYLNLAVIQIADITGVWGVSFLVMLINVAIWRFFSGFRVPLACARGRQGSGFRERFFYLLPSLVLLLCVLIYGFYKMNLYAVPCTLSPIKISVIQGNISQELKWDPAARQMIMDKYLDLSRQAVKDKPNLIIWPEAAIPVVLEDEPRYYEEVANLAREIRRPLLMGAVRFQDGLYYNTAILISEQGKLLNRYSKLHLVPFGEYIPLRKLFPFLETVVPIGDFTAGKEYTVFNLFTLHSPLSTKFSVLICFEDLFPELSRNFVKRGAEFLVNITNDAWFGKTSSPYQHLSASVFRAVENRRSLVRAANTGVSGFIAPSGRILSLVQDRQGKTIFVAGYQTSSLDIPKGNLTFYDRFAGAFIFGCVFIILYVIITLPLKKR